MRSVVLAGASWLVAIVALGACGEEDGVTERDGDAAVSSSSSGGSSGASSGIAASSSGGSSGGSEDAGHDAFVDSEAGTCALEGYPIAYSSTPAEDDAVNAAIAAFVGDASDLRVVLDETNGSVVSIAGEPPLALNPEIADPCERAQTALLSFITEHAAFLRAPADMTVKNCRYDELVDSEIVRLEGGTYFGRRLISGPVDIVAHVRRDGHLRYCAASYEPVLAREPVTPCLDGTQAENAVIGHDLGFLRFEACRPGEPGTIEVVAADTRTALETGVYIDAQRRLHYVRLVDTLLAEERVNADVGNSDLYCCSEATVKDCVGKTLVIDELTGEVLAEIPRCHTC